MRLTFLILTVLAARPCASAATVPDGGRDLISASAQPFVWTEKGGCTGKTRVTGTDFTEATRPKVTYEGREADAAWRKTALTRIAKIRMADHSAQLTDEAGKPLANTRVTVELARHDFGFGDCVTRQMLTRKDPDGERYRDIVNRTCSRVVFENDLKPGSFLSSGEGRARMEESIAWLRQDGISIRGHYLIQEAVDPCTRARLGDPEKLKRDKFESVRERIELMGRRVSEWDAINQPVAWGGAALLGTKGPPLDTLAMDLFDEARKLTDLPLIINEDQIFRPGTPDLPARVKTTTISAAK